MNKVQNLLRLTFAVIFVVGAAANVYMLVFVPDIYRSFSDASFFPFYRQLWAAYVFPNIQFFVGFVALMEVGFAALLLYKKRGPQVGLPLAAAFMLFLVPFWWLGGSLINLVFALVFIWLWRFEYPHTIPDLLRGTGSAPDPS
jgi:hypothetical protein